MIDVACGSGDAQTLCIVDDDSVWSWGDGDYGKLGRGGSDGCKVPMRIDGLANQGIIKASHRKCNLNIYEVYFHAHEPLDEVRAFKTCYLKSRTFEKSN